MVSIIINLVLTFLQVIGGFFSHSQALMADGLHSLSDLLSDILVLYANRHGNRHADANHPYGHARVETAATMILGIFLAVLGIGLLVAAALRLQNPGEVHAVNPLALAIAVVALIAKEGMFRYMLAVAKRVRSQMLVANAWHARSDAASSLIVIVGVAGNLLGYTFLDLVAAAVVGVMIAHMGGKLAFEALEELIDTGLDAEEVAAIRQTLLDTHGVLGLHDLRTRKMADNALVDAHILVDPRISVSEGHYIAESARNAVLSKHHVLDVMVHIDPEDDRQSKRNIHLPNRPRLLAGLVERLSDLNIAEHRVVLHYLDGKIDAELYLPGEITSQQQAAKLQQQCDEMVRDDPIFRAIRIHTHHAQK
ncbi:MAG: cation diffusion facilitator family transporter [Gallionella sp.]|nr:cation diffusion facilitator family transporter [Gallionella sp.]MDD4945343.1 cation diffusion facilitator family transporter [Gallionella sp.]MDD5611756.1 cation diffusion facilitator family transporter [Gallionella sp.]